VHSEQYSEEYEERSGDIDDIAHHVSSEEECRWYANGDGISAHRGNGWLEYQFHGLSGDGQL